MKTSKTQKILKIYAKLSAESIKTSMSVTMRDDTNIHCHALKGNGNNKRTSKRDGDDKKTMTDCSKNTKDVFQFNFFEIYRHIVTLCRKDNTTLIFSRDDKRDDARFIVAK